MKFGPVTLDGPSGTGPSPALGAVLAHTARLPAGGAIKKGRILRAEDIERLRGAGLREVVVARLESTDVHEDAAAEAIANALHHDTVRADEAHTGRVNLRPRHAGLFRVRPAIIDAINSVSPAITLATVADFAAVEPHTLVATVKLIPFAVPRAALDEVLRVIADARDSAFEVRRFVRRQAGLVLTELPGLDSQLLARASRTQRERMRRLGGRIGHEVRCGHRAPEIARALKSLRGEGCDLLLVLGASAIVDDRDVIPEGVRLAGGQVLQVGMPVDPGNLLMEAVLEGIPVIGVPGCARSLNPSGFDFVLSRLAAGLEVGPRVLSGMGVGGLLKEVQSRPQPRERRKRRATPQVAGIVLAAGPRVTAEHIEAHLRVMRAVGAAPVVVVVRPGADAVQSPGAQIVVNAEAEWGLSTSVRLGLEATGAEPDAVLMALGDRAPLSETDTRRLLAALDSDGGATVIVPMFQGRRGHPVVWAREHFVELMGLRGDVGGKALMGELAEAICYIQLAGGAAGTGTSHEDVHE